MLCGAPKKEDKKVLLFPADSKFMFWGTDSTVMLLREKFLY
jgi:hypothetical protein